MAIIDIHNHSISDLTHIRSIRLGVEPINNLTPLVSAAIHPWDVADVDIEAQLSVLRTLIKQKKVCAISETGLDYIHTKTQSGRKDEEQCFIKHCHISYECDLPLVIHSVKANDKIVEILKQHKPINAIIHSFIGSGPEAENFIKQGAYLSVSPRSLKSPRTVEAICNTPTEWLFCETDTSTTSINEVYKELSLIKGYTQENLEAIIYNNFKKIFNL